MDRLVATVSRIFKERYGTQLIIQNKGNTQSGKTPLFHSHWPSAFVYSCSLKQVSFPIFNSKKQLLALATAYPVENKDAVIFDEMAQFLQLTIAEHMELSEQQSLKIDTERAIAEAHNDPSKVVQLKTKRINSARIEYKRIETQREANLDPIWIQGASQRKASQIAFSVHDWINHWAFINAKEIPDIIWSDSTGWDHLSQATLFIPDIQDLETEQLHQLEANMKSIMEQTGSRPLIIVSSQGELTPELKNLQLNFRRYQAKDHVTPRIQAHFLLFSQQQERHWAYECKNTDQVYYLPFSRSSETLH